MKRLIQFINRHHVSSDVLFWPDLATSHFANKVKEYLDGQNIKFVPKQKNPPITCLKLGLLNNFGLFCKQRYSMHKKMPKNLNGFKRDWKKLAPEVAEQYGESLMRHGKKNVLKISKKGVKK